MEKLKEKIKKVIIESLNLEDMTPEDIDSDAPLFGEGLGLDSIDALELGLALKNEFGINLSAQSNEIKQHFLSVTTLAQFIQANQKRNER